MKLLAEYLNTIPFTPRFNTVIALGLREWHSKARVQNKLNRIMLYFESKYKNNAKRIEIYLTIGHAFIRRNLNLNED